MSCLGDVLDGRYRLDGPIARGGMGEVWRATDMALGRTVAVKLLRSAPLTDPQSEARFQAEARMMAVLAHPNLINVYDYGHAPPAGDGAAYLVMSYVDAKPLSRRIAEAGRLSVAETVSVLVQAARALHAAHRVGIIHCDVKPANLLVALDGSVTLIDFGAARRAAVNATVVSVVVGTAFYMAPEQVTGQPVSPATDVYALGAVAYHCLAGRPPFTGGTPLQIALRHLSEQPPPLPPDVPPALHRLVARAMNKDPARRYPSAAHFAVALRHVLTDPGPASPTTQELPVAVDQTERTQRSWRRVAPVASAAAMLLLGAGTVAVVLVLGAAQQASTSTGAQAGTSTPAGTAVAASGQTTTTPAQPGATQPDAAPPTVDPASAMPLLVAVRASQASASATPSGPPAPPPTPAPSSTMHWRSGPPTMSPSAITASAPPSTTPEAS